MIVILGITNHCNLKCWYCYGQYYARREWPDFKTEELLEIIDSLADMGTKILQLHGGEPLLRGDLHQIITHAQKRGMLCDMFTNGTLIKEKQDIVKLLDKICISLDGPAEKNDQNRGEQTTAKILEGIKICQQLKVPTRISAVFTSATTPQDIDWLIDFSKKNQIPINFCPSFDYAPSVKDLNAKPHDMPDTQIKELFTHILEAKKKGAMIQFSPQSYELAQKWPLSFKQRTMTEKASENNQAYPACFHGKYVFFIDADGNVYPCSNFWGKPSVNIRDKEIKKAINEFKADTCSACYIPAYIDRNLFFQGSFKVWWNYMKQTIREIL